MWYKVIHSPYPEVHIGEIGVYAGSEFLGTNQLRIKLKFHGNREYWFDALDIKPVR